MAVRLTPGTPVAPSYPIPPAFHVNPSPTPPSNGGGSGGGSSSPSPPSNFGYSYTDPSNGQTSNPQPVPASPAPPILFTPITGVPPSSAPSGYATMGANFDNPRGQPGSVGASPTLVTYAPPPIPKQDYFARRSGYASSELSANIKAKKESVINIPLTPFSIPNPVARADAALITAPISPFGNPFAVAKEAVYSRYYDVMNEANNRGQPVSFPYRLGRGFLEGATDPSSLVAAGAEGFVLGKGFGYAENGIKSLAYARGGVGAADTAGKVFNTAALVGGVGLTAYQFKDASAEQIGYSIPGLLVGLKGFGEGYNPSPTLKITDVSLGSDLEFVKGDNFLVKDLKNPKNTGDFSGYEFADNYGFSNQPISKVVTNDLINIKPTSYSTNPLSSDAVGGRQSLSLGNDKLGRSVLSGTIEQSGYVKGELFGKPFEAPLNSVLDFESFGTGKGGQYLGSGKQVSSFELPSLGGKSSAASRTIRVSEPISVGLDLDKGAGIFLKDLVGKKSFVGSETASYFDITGSKELASSTRFRSELGSDPFDLVTRFKTTRSSELFTSDSVLVDKGVVGRGARDLNELFSVKKSARSTELTGEQRSSRVRKLQRSVTVSNELEGGVVLSPNSLVFNGRNIGLELGILDRAPKVSKPFEIGTGGVSSDVLRDFVNNNRVNRYKPSSIPRSGSNDLVPTSNVDFSVLKTKQRSVSIDDFRVGSRLPSVELGGVGSRSLFDSFIRFGSSAGLSSSRISRTNFRQNNRLLFNNKTSQLPIIDNRISSRMDNKIGQELSPKIDLRFNYRINTRIDTRNGLKTDNRFNNELNFGSGFNNPPPRIIPKIPPFGLPSGGAQRDYFSRSKRGSNKLQYTPGFTAVALGIKSKVRNPRSTGFTGLETRGLLKSVNKGKRLKI